MARLGEHRPPEQLVLEISRSGRVLVGAPLFTRGEQLPLARGRVKVG